LLENKDNITGSGDLTEKIIGSANRYLTNKNKILEVSHQVRGDQHNNFEKTGYASAGSIVEYQINIDNPSDEKVSSMVIMGVLPAINDISITDLASRGSEFELELLGPINIPSEWEGKVEVTHSEARHPERANILDKNTIYPESAIKLSNPADVETTIWLTEAEVIDSRV
jgi:hypothetical protein